MNIITDYALTGNTGGPLTEYIPVPPGLMRGVIKAGRIAANKAFNTGGGAAETITLATSGDNALGTFDFSAAASLTNGAGAVLVLNSTYGPTGVVPDQDTANILEAEDQVKVTIPDLLVDGIIFHMTLEWEPWAPLNP